VIPTTAWATSMSAMHGMSMHASAHAWPRAYASFVAMWTAMMVAMMLPSLAPALWHYHRAVADRVGAAARAGWPAAVVAAGYYTVWAGIGVALAPLGTALAAAEMRLPASGHATPRMVGVVVLAVGAIQLSAWKARQLAHCRVVPSRDGSSSVKAAWHHGLRLGVRCSLSCAGPMAILLVVGIMDLRAMGLVTAAITAERLAPDGVRIARGMGVVAVMVGLLLVARVS
jgi:predicted metal-binding membrane protein